MLRSETLFGKREIPKSPLSTASSLATNAASNLSTSVPPSATNNSMNTNPANTNPTSPASTNEVGSKLIVGKNIKLEGKITDCDTLVVEGFVKATIEARMIQIAEGGTYEGPVTVDIAEIRGEFDGELTVRQTLVIYATGKVSGKIRYGKVVIEEGGQLSGDVQVGAGAAPRSLTTVAKTAL